MEKHCGKNILVNKRRIMGKLRSKLIKFINEKPLLHERKILVSQELDKVIVYYYKSNPQRYNK